MRKDDFKAYLRPPLDIHISPLSIYMCWIWHKRFSVLLTLIALVHFLTPLTEAFAQPRLAQNLQQLMKTANQVIKTEEGVVYVSISKQSFAKDTQVLLMRKKGLHLEVIANGRVAAEQILNGKPALLVQLKTDEIIKTPQAGDFAVAISEPGQPDSAEKKNDVSLLKPAEAKTNSAPSDPGYVELGMGLMFGNMSSSPSAEVNQFKSPFKYRFARTHWAYFSEYLPIGIEQSKHWGVFPTSTYYLDRITSDEKVSNFRIFYRPKKFFGFLRLMPHLYFLSDEFNTNNIDENLLTTHYGGTGIGLRTSFEFVENLWKPSGRFPLALEKIFAEVSYVPSLKALDIATVGAGVSRGTSSEGSTALDIGIGATAMLYLEFIPLFKRIIFEGGYRFRSYSLKFSGSTISEVGGNTVPENITAKEREKYYYFMVGLRIEDPIKLAVDIATGKLLGKKDKSKDKPVEKVAP